MKIDLSSSADKEYKPNLHTVHQFLEQHIVGEHKTRMGVFTNWLLANQNVNMAGQRSSGKTWIADNVAKLLPEKGGLYTLTAGSDKSQWYEAEALKRHSHVLVPELNKLSPYAREVLKDWGEGKSSTYRVTVMNAGTGRRSVEKHRLDAKPFIFCLADEDEAKIDPQLRSRLTVVRTDISEEQNVSVMEEQAQQAINPKRKQQVPKEEVEHLKFHIATLPPWDSEAFRHPAAMAFIKSIPSIFTDCRRDFRKYLNNTYGITRFYWKERMSMKRKKQMVYFVTPEDMYLNHEIYGRTLMESSLKCNSMERQMIDIVDENGESGMVVENVQGKMRKHGMNVSIFMLRKHLGQLADLGYIEKIKVGKDPAIYRVGALFKDFSFNPNWEQVIEECKKNMKEHYPELAEEYIRRFCTDPVTTNPFTGGNISIPDVKYEEKKPKEFPWAGYNPNFGKQQPLVVEEEVVE